MDRDSDAERTSLVDDANEFDSLLRRAARLTPRPGALQHGLLPGARLCGGRFEIKRRIGAGGMGVVYEAFDHERGLGVALKTLARLEPTDVYRLKNEFRALAEVTHPNLVRLHELFGDDGLWLFTMELIAGRPLDEWVRPAGQLDPSRLRTALAHLVAGVRAIHDAGKLHRDIKPNNVLVTETGHRRDPRLRLGRRSRSGRRGSDCRRRLHPRHAGVHGTRAVRARTGEQRERLVCGRCHAVRGA